MATIFTPPGRKTLYHRALIPLRLRHYFKGREQLWRSLKTTDPDEAKLKSLQWDTRAQRVFLTLKRQGGRMTPAEIETLIAHWMDSQLEEFEDALADFPIDDEDRDDFLLIRSGLLEDLSEDLDHCNYRRVEQEADEILKAANMPRLAHDSIKFKRLCRRLLLAKMDLMSTQADRERGIYKDRKVPAPLPTAPPPVKKSPLFSVIAKKYLAENPRARRTADQVRVELDKFLKAIGGDRAIASITKNEGRTYKEHLIQDRGVSLATVAKHLHTLSGLFTWAEKQGFNRKR
jgi:hypothetical protein